MSDIVLLFSNFPYNPLTQSLLASFESCNLTTADLLSLSAGAIAKRTGREVVDVTRFLDILYKTVIPTGNPKSVTDLCDLATSSFRITSGDALIDDALGGGFPIGCITEIAGESSTGKSHLLMQLCLCVQLPSIHGGLGRPAVYISTESGLETRRLSQLSMAVKSRHDNVAASQVKLENVLCITCGDLEVQDHVIKYQLPVLVHQRRIGLIVIDSIASHYRAEHGNRGSAGLSKRGNELVQHAELLRNLAADFKLAVVIANQVRDQFARANNDNHHGTNGGDGGYRSQDDQQRSSQSRQLVSVNPVIPFEEIFGDETGEFPTGSQLPIDQDVLSLDYQTRFCSGWDWIDQDNSDGGGTGHKVPTLGNIWTNCINQRIVLKRQDDGKRSLEVVFSPYAPSSKVNFEIKNDGLWGIA
ncbi:P-loop containing nucleoside triphosphate hydrolase protein [Lipomyces japonicus]|uniref:P-loop containing nucleoside triphosphate hydrolase protein n=1 Tax=Lipomyces japonicus TaxID=56871 RepID=UPI0034CF3598